MRFHLLFLSMFITPAVSILHGFTDPLLRIRHMIPPTVPVREHMQNNEIHVFETGNDKKENKPCILFFTGGNSLITYEIYSAFLTSLANKQVSIYTIPFRYSGEEFEKLVTQLKSEYSDIVALSHSSGSSPLIDAISKTPEIAKIVMMDPIDSRLDRTKKIRLKYLKNLMIVRAEKAYEGENLSFIPSFLELSEDKLKLPPDCTVRVLDAEEYGHCDLLNPIYSNLIHQYLRNICDGSSDRSYYRLYNYIDWITTEIATFARSDSSPDDKSSIRGGDDSCDELPCDI